MDSADDKAFAGSIMGRVETASDEAHDTEGNPVGHIGLLPADPAMKPMEIPPLSNAFYRPDVAQGASSLEQRVAVLEAALNRNAELFEFYVKHIYAFLNVEPPRAPDAG